MTAQQTNPPSGTGPRLTVDTVIVHDGQVLLIRRANEPYQGKWAVPGGFVDSGETVEQAAVREAQEETGLHVRLDRLLGVYSHPARDPRGHTVSIAYLASPRPDEDPNKAYGASDATEAAWFPLDDLPGVAFDHDQILEHAAAHLQAAQEEGPTRYN